MPWWNPIRRRRAPAPRLPQDVLVSGSPPETVPPSASVDALAERHREALRRGDHDRRARTLWELVGHGDAAAGWCAAAVRDDDPDLVEDAAGVLAWIGTPPDLVPALLERIAALPDGQARDALVMALPAAERAALTHDDDAAAASIAADDGVVTGHEIWFLEAPYERVVAAYGRWRSAIGREGRLTEHRGPLGNLLRLLDPPIKPHWKTLFVETAAPWTAIFTQSGSGGDWTPQLASDLRTRALRAHHSVHRTDDAGVVEEYGDVAFWLFDGARDDLPQGQVRAVQASRGDSGWTWHLIGEPQPFEDLARYEERRIPRRFDRELLDAYCDALGLRRTDPGFYGPRATLVEAGWHARG